MSLRWPGTLAVGDAVRFEDTAWTVVGLAGAHVRLADRIGTVKAVDLGLLQREGTFARGADRRLPMTRAALAGVQSAAAAEALRWEPHILEVYCGQPIGGSPGAVPRPEFDPRRTSTAEREKAKSAELTAAGWEHASEDTVKTKRQRYEAGGVMGLVDGRKNKKPSPGQRTDPSVLAAIDQVAAESVDASTRDGNWLRWRVEQVLMESCGPDAVAAMPNRAQFFKILNARTEGLHVTGSGKTRRSQASKPEAPYGTYTVLRPGELVEIDATPLDIAVQLDRGVVGRVELIAMTDVATRSIPAAVLTPTGKSVDAPLMLARAVTTEPMRPGWSRALSLSRSILPSRHLVDVDRRLTAATARPLILPERIVYDKGAIFVSDNFRAACNTLGIDAQPTHPGSPAEKPHIEEMNFSVGGLFCQYVAGYLGRSVVHRGRNPESGPLWALFELQDLLDQWVVCTWQNRPYDGLRDPRNPTRILTPNEKYSALVEVAGIVPLALSPDDYVELLPSDTRAFNRYGIKIGHRTYDNTDDPRLAEFRGQRSGVAQLKGRWEVHYDPLCLDRHKGSHADLGIIRRIACLAAPKRLMVGIFRDAIMRGLVG